MARKLRIPGLQVPPTVDSELAAFLNAVKERLEVASGERGDPENRAITARDLRDAGPIDTSKAGQRLIISRPVTPSGSGSNTVERLDFTIYPEMQLSEAHDDTYVLVQGISPSERYRVALADFLNLFLRKDYEVELGEPVLFEAEDYAYIIATPAPRFRMREEPEDSDAEPTRPSDENVWDFEVDGSEFSIYLVSDDEETRTKVLSLTRSGTSATALKFNDSQVLVRDDVRTAEVDVGSSPRKSGRFTLVDDRIASTSKLLVTLAPGPYSGKGTLADEAEMYAGIGFAATPAEGSATVYWSCPWRVRGNIKVNYIIG